MLSNKQKVKISIFSPKEICYHSIFRVEHENIAKATSLVKNDCHCRKLVIMEELKWNHRVGIKLKTPIKKYFCCTSILYFKEVKNKQEVSLVADLNTFCEEQ